MLAIDHVIIVAVDLPRAADELFARYGLASLPGGRHPGHGTENRIVPLGGSYLELMGVADATEAGGSALGRWALAQRSENLIPRALCLRTVDIAPIGTALEEEPLAMHRLRPDGVRIGWRLAGLEGMLAGGAPFFIEWEVEPEHHPGAGIAPHRVQPHGITGVVLGTVTGPLARTVAATPGLTITRFRSGVRQVTVGTEGGVVELGVRS